MVFDSMWTSLSSTHYGIAEHSECPACPTPASVTLMRSSWSLVLRGKGRHAGNPPGTQSHPGLWFLAGLLDMVLAACVPQMVEAQQTIQLRAASTAVQPIFEPQPAGGPERLPSTQPVKAFTLDELEQLALANNPTVGRAWANVAATRGTWLQSGLPPNPAVGYLGAQLGSGGRAEQHGLLIQQEFVRGGKLRLNRAVALQEIARAEQEFAIQQQRVLTDVRIHFYDALVAQRRLELSRQLTQIAVQAADAAHRLNQAGETTRSDVLQAQLEVESAEIELVQAQNRHIAAWRSLTAIVGVPPFGPATLQGDLEAATTPLNWDQSVRRLLAESPEIVAAVADIDRMRAALAREQAEPVPNVTVEAVVMQDNAIGGRTDGILQVTLPLPLWNRNEGGIGRAAAELAAAHFALQQREQSLLHRLAPVFERYATAAEQVSRYRERILPTAKESLDLARNGYLGGEFPYLQLLNALRTYSRANLDYLEVLRELQSATAEIDGLLLHGSLQPRS
jgi:outer membrane protein, heavy metal efflux system